MQLAYLEMLGAGNRILVVDQRVQDLPPPPPPELRRLAKDSTGPRFDQLMWVSPPHDSTTAASYRIFNSDGSEAEQCGNGVRCVVWMLARENPVSRLSLESPAGPVEAKILGGQQIAVSMGTPVFDPARVPFVTETQVDRYDLDVDDETLVVSVLSMGNPHCILEVDDVEVANVGGLGPLIERHTRFPAATNVGFMQIRDRTHISLRVHERGVGETPACGTGACAAVVAGQGLSLLDEEVAVQLPGGQLVVSWRGKTEPVWLTGNAELISEGTVEL